MLSLSCIKYAESVLDEDLIFADGMPKKPQPIAFAVYLLQAEGRNILVDAGCDTMPGFVMQDFRSPAEILSELGVSADAVTDVIITHAHHDHIEAVPHFRNAVLYITGEEYADGKKYIPAQMEVHIVPDVYEILPGVRIVKIGGHAAGSAVVEIEDGETVHVLAGDECYVNDCILQRRPTGASYSPDKSRAFIEKYSNAKYHVYTCHDISLKTAKIL